MDCDTCREAVSARADGEAEPVPAEETDAHLASCADCRRWQERAAALTRDLRVRPATDVPDLTAAVLATAAATPPVARATRGWYWRMGLAGVAVAQLTLGIAQVFGVDDVPGHGAHTDGAPASTHLFNESTAWNLAVGLGLLWTALRPRAVTGVLPVVAAFVASLVPFSVNDLLTGAVPLSRVTSHVFLVLGLALLVVVRRTAHAPDDGSHTTERPGDHRLDVDDTDDPGRQSTERGRPRHLRPVTNERAA
ncbi:zf-HC2 domain-containing protein [Saccharothrix sp. S26]|uniref:zf-HC2 domain-containing protein n=1 Tax=Saccharothrix sp. S26 TaxID=2907215 RepID=UPI001F34E52E|nr:zf-HC2 domain-containing protein [Saccharothrix sp. S26]MCE6996361.1 zf-HC2 domain-containing protein [Saccharothrix sp. S26]